MSEPQIGLLARLDHLVWGNEPAPARKPGLLRLVRTLLILGRDLALGQLTLRAMSLVYTTLLSIVPLLALSFSVLKAFGVTNQIEPILLRLLEPLGPKGVEVAQRITEFIQHMNVGVLGALGLALLLFTAISLIQKIEESLNYIWHIDRPRSLASRFSRYLTALMVGPILVFAALGVTASVMNIGAVRALVTADQLGQMVQVGSRVLPYLLIIVAFTFVYMYIPNARVRLLPALAGGVVGGVAWQTAGWAFALFIASSNNYTAIYSGFAILVLFMIWLHVCWLVLLFGASVAFYLQHPEYLYAGDREPRLSNRMRERLALSAMTLVAQRFLAGERPPSQPEFTQGLKVPMHVLQATLGALERRALIVATDDDPPAYLPGHDPGLITVAEVLDTIRASGEERFLSPGELPLPASVDAVLERVQQAALSALDGMTLRDLAARTSVSPLGKLHREPADPIWVENA